MAAKDWAATVPSGGGGAAKGLTAAAAANLRRVWRYCSPAAAAAVAVAAVAGATAAATVAAATVAAAIVAEGSGSAQKRWVRAVAAMAEEGSGSAAAATATVATTTAWRRARARARRPHEVRVDGVGDAERLEYEHDAAEVGPLWISGMVPGWCCRRAH